MESVRTQKKVKLLFDKLYEPNYVMNSYYADSFINKISNTSDPETSNLIGIPFLRDLLIEYLGNPTTGHETAKVFLGRLLAIVVRKEHHFNKVLEKRNESLLTCFNNINSDSMSPSLKVAYLEVALSLVTHNSGISWILKTELWKKILSLYEEPTTIFVLRLVYKFASEFLWKMENLDDENSLNVVISHISKPILELNIIRNIDMTPEKEDEYCKTFEPVLQILFSTLLAKNDRMNQKNKIMSILVKEISLPTHLIILMESIRNDHILQLTMKLMFIANLLRVFQVKPYFPGVNYTIEDFVMVQAYYFNMIHFLIQRRNIKLLVDFGSNCNTIWRTFSKDFNIDLTTDDKNGKIQNQMLFIYVIPLLVHIKTTQNSCQEMKNERILEYITTFVHTSCEHTARAAYALRDLILEHDTLNVIFHSVKRLTSVQDHLNDTQANLLFKALFFVLADYDPTDYFGEVENEDFEVSEQKVQVMTYIMDSILALVKHYNIKWHASLEVICLNSIVHNILTRRQNLTCKFVVSALGVMTVTVKKFLPPNLSLLMDSQPGSATHEIGKLIFVKMHDVHWEVRDSALELLHVCIEISYIKFPPIQKQLIENNLIPVSATMALNDHESYVQVSALKCLGAACKIASMWEQLKTEHPNILEQLLGMLCHNQEGIVRKEVCNVLCEVYQNTKLTPQFKQCLYEHMASSAMSDFHWEVQLSALKFWKIVIQSYLTDQGWLDGTFPAVTFSRESRKIVTLNEVEIRKRLLRVLDDLASVGCLTVLLKLLHEDTEVEVMETALVIADELQAILHQYKVPEVIVLGEGEPKSMAELVCHIKEEDSMENGDEMEPESTSKSDNVIEGILKSDDMNLLASIYQKRMNLDTAEAKDITPKMKLVKAASPYLFVHYMDFNDCKNLIKQKKEWNEGIRSISSLLDDVLGLYGTNEEANSLDCY